MSELKRITKDDVRTALHTIYEDPIFIEDLITSNQTEYQIILDAQLSSDQQQVKKLEAEKDKKIAVLEQQIMDVNQSCDLLEVENERLKEENKTLKGKLGKTEYIKETQTEEIGKLKQELARVRAETAREITEWLLEDVPYQNADGNGIMPRFYFLTSDNLEYAIKSRFTPKPEPLKDASEVTGITGVNDDPIEHQRKMREE
jgi:hypothetical protein